MSVLDANDDRRPKARLVSTAGPSVPVMKPQTDAVPNGWMARLEAARMAVAPSSQPPAAAPQVNPSKPPPLKSSPPKPAEPNLPSKPAHLLVAQLEAEEKKRKEAEQKRIEAIVEEKTPDEIAKVELDLSTEPKRKKRIPEWVWIGSLLLVVGGGLAYAFMRVKEEPPPVVQVDPKLQEEAEKKKKAVAALELGHAALIEAQAADAQKDAAKAKEVVDKAIAAYQEALTFNPQLAPAERGLAISYDLKDQKADALTHYKRYLELSPEAKDADDIREVIRRHEKPAEPEKKRR